MSTKTKVDALWQQFREAINAAYKAADDESRGKNGSAYANDGITLRDYAENTSWSDDLAGLLGRETAYERQHRSNRPSVSGFSTETAAKLLIMNAASRGALRDELPKATAFLVLRQTMAEAEVIGYLSRKHLLNEWHMALGSLDYAKLMKT